MWATIQHDWPQYIIIAAGIITNQRSIRRAHKKVIQSVKMTNRITMTAAAQIMNSTDKTTVPHE
jgi:hypothetical protein